MGMDLLALVLFSLFGLFVGVTVASVVMGGFVLSLFGITVPLLLAEQAEAEERKRRYQKLTALGLQPAGKGTFEGKVDGRPVWYRLRIEQGEIPRPLHGWGVQFGSGTLSVSPYGSAPRALRTGDPRFDRCFRVNGTPTDRARLIAPVRARLLRLRRHVVLRVENGILWCEFPRFDPEHLARALEVARSLTCEAPDPDQRLLLAATTDPVPGVRRQLLAHAAAGYPRAVPALARALRQDPDPLVRAEAILALQEPEDLVGLASTAVPSLKISYRQKAARLLLEVGSPEQRRRAGEALASQRARALHGHALALLCSVPDGEAGLIELIKRVDSRWLGRVVVALGEVGTVAAVPALRARQARLSLLQGRLSQIIDRTVARIQSDSGGEAGRLALAAPMEIQGAVSVAGQPGAISIARRIGQTGD